MKTIHTCLFALSAVLVPALAADAAETPLRRAACEYRDAAQHFERTVHKVRFIDHYDVRLVGRLENAACDLHGASHNLRDLDRLSYRWHDVQALHNRVASAIFGRDCYPRHPALIECWERVSCAYETLAREIECVCRVDRGHREHRGHGAPVVDDRFGTTFGLTSRDRFDLAVPAHPFPRSAVPPTPFPSIASPRVWTPDTLGPESRFRAPVTAPQPRNSHADETRYFGRRPVYPSPNARLTGNDLKAAVIGAMLSRLAR